MTDDGPGPERPRPSPKNRGNRTVVAGPDRLYVRGGPIPLEGAASGSVMPEIVSSLCATSRPLVLAAAVGAGMLLAAALALWAYYGSTLFYEMILAGLAACF